MPSFERETGNVITGLRHPHASAVVAFLAFAAFGSSAPAKAQDASFACKVLLCALSSKSLLDGRSLLRSGDEPALQHPEQRRLLADMRRRQCLARGLQPIRRLSRGFVGGFARHFEKRLVLCRRFGRRLLRHTDRFALRHERRLPKRRGVGGRSVSPSPRDRPIPRRIPSTSRRRTACSNSASR